MNILNQFDFRNWLTAVVASGTDVAIVESAAIDCSGFDRICAFLNIAATATENGTVKFYLEASATAAGLYTAITGATIGTHTHAGSGETAKIYAIDAPVAALKPFVKIVYQRETQATAFGISPVLLYDGKLKPAPRATAYKESAVV